MSVPGQVHRIVIAEQDTVPEEYGLALDADLVEPEATNDHPAVLRVSLRNQTGHERFIKANNQPPLPSMESQQSNPRLVLVPTGRPASDPHPVPIALGCWQIAEQIGEVLARDIGRIGPEASRERECTVWGALDNDEPCLPTGTYRFEGTYDGTESETRPMLRWGFTLSITDAYENSNE